MNADGLLETTIAITVSTLLVLLLRRPLRATCGAGAAYALWALVPASLLAVLLPAAAIPAAPAVLLAPVLGAMPAVAAAPVVAGSTDWLLAAWLAGALAMALLQVAWQRRFMNSLGTLHRRADGLVQSEASAGLPAVLGWRARIVLPVDFEQRYDERERELVLCHERVHQRRGDLPAAGLVSLLRCVFWFNPLVHLAAVRFREDQELACDAAVLRRYPDSRRRYGDALLKTQLADQPLPIGCHWFGSHPLKERIEMLKRPVPGPTRRIAGLLLALSLGLGGAVFAWAAQPATDGVPAGKLHMEVSAKIDGGEAIAADALLLPGQPHEFKFVQDGITWRFDVTLLPTADGGFDMSSEIHRGDELVGKPRLLFNDAGASIGIGNELPDGGFDGIHLVLRATAGAGAAPVSTETVNVAPDPRGNPPSNLLAPAYPADALAAGEGGVVMLKLRVSAEGKVLESLYVPESSTLTESSSLVQAARDAAMRWKLIPAMNDGKAVEGWVQVPVQFDPDSPGS